MSDVSKTNEALIAEAQEHYSEMNGLNSRAAEVMMELVAALEAKTGVRVDMSSAVGVEAQLAATRVPVQGKPPALTFDEAREMACVLSARGEFADGITVESIWARGAVWGALGGDRRNYVAVQGEPNDELIAALRERAASDSPAHTLMNEAADALASRATVPDAATERERDDIETRLSEYLCDSTGGKLSKTGYDVRTMVAHTEDYYDGLHADARKEIEAERDAALAVVARVRAIHQREVIAVHPGIGEEAWCPACQEHWPCSTVAALDGAPESEWEYGLGNRKSPRDAGIPYPDEAHVRWLASALEETPTFGPQLMRRRKAGPWLPVEGESK